MGIYFFCDFHNILVFDQVFSQKLTFSLLTQQKLRVLQHFQAIVLII